jgi:sigma-E factor negative regulatory protein RseA
MVMREDISSLMDGECEAGRAGGLIERVGRDEKARDEWATYHVIGDVLRGDVAQMDGIQSRIFARLAEEPTVLAPRARSAIFPPGRSVRVGMAVAASVATISVVVWMARQEVNAPAPMAQTATAPTVAQAMVQPAEMAPVASIQPANVNEYLLAHEEFSQSTAGYRLTTVTTPAPASGAAGR